MIKKCKRFLKILLSLSIGTAFGFAQVNPDKWSKEDLQNIPKGENMQVLIIGANGSVAKWVIGAFLNTEVKLKLYLRNAQRLETLKSTRVEVIEGDATDVQSLKKAMSGVNVVYANLAGDLPLMAQSVIEAMKESHCKRLIWISSMGIYQNDYQELPDRHLGSISAALKPYRESALLIEDSGLDYTIIRPSWFSNIDEIDYELTQKGEAFKNSDKLISRKSIAHLVVRLALETDFGIRQSLGINKP